MKSREDAVSGAVGGVLLIALVLIGAAIVGTWVTSKF
jgi:FlaG/FlaF family flagellin (archaellin)